jgi:hypothetical protein
MRLGTAAVALCSTLGCGLRPPAQPEVPGTCLSITTDLPADLYDPWLFEPPPLVLLTADGWPGGDRYLLDEVPTSLPATHPFKTWRMKGQDSVEMTWADGAQGVQVVLPLIGDTLRGRAITLDHMVHEDSGVVGSAVGIRRPCEAEVPLQHHRTRPQLSVELADGSYIHAGMSVPEHWPSSETYYGHRQAPIDARGVFARELEAYT